ncbi:hypothetical protein OBP_070 [Pseudomonas phage OBP]|uniref:hypothetical protein n=1 Tax=Pseudomonas phage OBP TaxID=1124849 RepID=UPI000240D424|nr:hypothetical protein OBP_070 [Pseudomonas phage OBP]AEV89507.1 hypothetical protein OBP_070 [Pseudomonas phage OBP]
MSMNLVKARCGLTNYYHQQVIRNPVLNLETTLIDQLTEENMMGGVNGSTLKMAAVMGGGLNAQASGFANIMDGWNDSKGLMMLDFCSSDSPVAVEYMHVIGYVTNNGAEQGLTMDALFTPVMSWKSHESITASGMLDSPTSVRRKMGGRTDYILNDGSQMGSVVSLRPSDIIDYSIEKASSDDILERMQDEGMDGMVPQTTVAASDISRVGVVTSKRGNLNPTNYATDMLVAGTGYQRNQQLQSNMMDSMGENTTQFDGMFNDLSQLAYQSRNKEPELLRDDFFREMMEMMGQAQMRGFRGYTIGDLEMAFPNINEVLDLTFMDKSEFVVNDFTADTESMGTSQLEEFVSQEITMNIMDLMIKYGLSEINFRGSNCDNYGGDGALSNVVVLPYGSFSLDADDYQLGQKTEAFVDDLTNQIFAKLNGLRPADMTPIRFDVSAELFGTLIVNMVRVDDSNIGGGFDMSAGGVPAGMGSRVYPTYAINNFGTVTGDKEQAQVAGSNFFSNLSSYFQS